MGCLSTAISTQDLDCDSSSAMLFGVPEQGAPTSSSWSHCDLLLVYPERCQRLEMCTRKVRITVGQLSKEQLISEDADELKVDQVPTMCLNCCCCSNLSFADVLQQELEPQAACIQVQIFSVEDKSRGFFLRAPLYFNF